MLQSQLMNSPAGQVLILLQRKGPATIKELEGALGVTATAVRQQTGNLLAEGYIQQDIERKGRGRPRHVYWLTPRGRALFPHHYDEFTNSLLGEILLTEGPQKVADLLGGMGRRLAEQYAREIVSQVPAERARELIELLNAKGILAEMQIESDGMVFREFNCPYYELARQYREICDMEQDMIAQVVKQSVELIACTLDGHLGCQFRIQADTSSIDDRTKNYLKELLIS
jgi:DeoR family transcriptional regulator, suf operon transcriptional repressor